MKAVRFHFDNLARHSIEWFEAEESLWDGWPRRKQNGDNYEVLGQTSEGRYLQLIVAIKQDFLWLFHARDMTPSEKRRYRKK